MPTGRPWFAPVMDDLPLRAGRFIVTLYGDVVEPRGGRLWMGHIIEACALVGISETLVRTAVSRLVAAGNLLGEKVGRKSCYALAEAAHAPYLEASERLFDPPAREGWCFLFLPGEGKDSAALLSAGFANLAPNWWLGPAGTAPPLTGAVTFAATADAPEDAMAAMARRFWDLDALALAHEDFIARFAPLEHGLTDGQTVKAADALALRLCLIDRYRAIVLKAPLLPPATYPPGWVGERARTLFARLYLALSPEADAHVARHFASDRGPLACQTAVTRQRKAALEAALEPASGQRRQSVT